MVIASRSRVRSDGEKLNTDNVASRSEIVACAMYCIKFTRSIEVPRELMWLRRGGAGIVAEIGGRGCRKFKEINISVETCAI